MFIAGKWEEAAGGRRFSVTNPANGEVLADVADGGAQDAARAIDAAFDAFPGWAGATAYPRIIDPTPMRDQSGRPGSLQNPEAPSRSVSTGVDNLAW